MSTLAKVLIGSLTSFLLMTWWIGEYEVFPRLEAERPALARTLSWTVLLLLLTSIGSGIALWRRRRAERQAEFAAVAADIAADIQAQWDIDWRVAQVDQHEGLAALELHRADTGERWWSVAMDEDHGAVPALGAAVVVVAEIDGTFSVIDRADADDVDWAGEELIVRQLDDDELVARGATDEPHWPTS